MPQPTPKPGICCLLRLPRFQSNRMDLRKNLVTPTSSLGISESSTPAPKSRLGRRFMWAICRLLSSHLRPPPAVRLPHLPWDLHPQPTVLKSVTRERSLPVQAFWSPGEHLFPPERLLTRWGHRPSKQSTSDHPHLSHCAINLFLSGLRLSASGPLLNIHRRYKSWTPRFDI